MSDKPIEFKGVTVLAKAGFDIEVSAGVCEYICTFLG
jgi:hypothetical protein